MLRKLLFTASIIASGLFANAQCVPDVTITDPGVYPDSATAWLLEWWVCLIIR